MQFSIKQIVWLIAWAALVLALICEIRIEAHRQRWTSHVPGGVMLVLNVTFSLYAILTAIATSSKQRIYWMGCSVVAVALTLCQIFQVRPSGIGTNAALLFEPLIFSGNEEGRAQVFRGGHLDQLEIVLIYCWIPIVACLGGWYCQVVNLRSRREPS